ncbi:MAG TPA: hypothetical protein IAC79_02720 [Candidatus Spyradenecus faecavium]|uniref:Uncharacterized protein n=1 Tax=Candidatus Spyradenecus faecavium TaxID=2840947 RepID=A0A9D1T369_9BACT|nr:hypothetical protein [Candidatus Spyradenecus faecavium]
MGHTHTLAQVSGLEAALAGKADATGVYTKAEVYAKGETYSRAEVDGKVAGVYHFRGSVQSRAELPTDPSDGDVYNLIGEDGMNVAWNAGAWDELGATVDLSAYSTTAQTTAAIQGRVQTAISQEASARNQAIAQAVAPKADSEDVYAKTETYTKSEVQSLVSQAVEAAKAALLSQLEGLYAPLSSVQHTTDGVTYRWSWDETFQTFAMKAVED